MPKLIDPNTGSTVHASRAGAVVLRSRGYRDAAGASTAPPVAMERPSRSAPRQTWDEYARSIGLDPDEFGSRADLIDAVEAYED